MNIELVDLVIVVTVLVLTVELNLEHFDKRLNDWKKSYYKSLSVLAEAHKHTF